jgi:hypothetical protein
MFLPDMANLSCLVPCHFCQKLAANDLLWLQFRYYYVIHKRRFKNIVRTVE